MSMKKYRYMVTWGGKTTYVTAENEPEAVKLAAAGWGEKWLEIYPDVVTVRIRSVKQ